MQAFYTVILSVLFNLSISSCHSSTEGSTAVNLQSVQDGLEVATFAGGCFWCTVAVFERVEGVKDVVSGYTGGKEENPTYYQVSYGETTHAEAVQIYFDPETISYQQLLDIFFATHDPTQLNRQGPDIGAQYRTAVFYHSEEQKKAVESTIKQLDESGLYAKKIVTEVKPYGKFWLAEDYHQNYYELNPGNPYIINIAVPKVKKFKKQFPQWVKASYANEK